jgi:hypothetical protein
MARMGVRLILDEELATTSGQFFTSTPGLRLLPTVQARTDDALQRAIWERTSELVGMTINQK